LTGAPTEKVDLGILKQVQGLKGQNLWGYISVKKSLNEDKIIRLLKA
jgi:hypothetical protein